jgi:hypothetical protein
MPLKIVRDALMATSAVTDLIQDRVGPLQAQQGETFPYVVLTLISIEPQNHLTGNGGLDRCTVQLDAYAFNYQDASAIANACRSALEALGHLCLSHVAGVFEFQPDAGVFRYGYIFQVWK